MRQLFGFFLMLSLSGLASAQNQNDGIWVPGAYAVPSAPRISTPIASPDALATPSLVLDSPPTVAGASAVPMSGPEGSPVQVNQPRWYAPGVALNSSLAGTSTAPAAAETSMPTPEDERRFETGAAIFQSSYGVAQLEDRMARRKADRVFTNSDIARLDEKETGGTIKYGGKIEHLAPASGN